MATMTRDMIEASILEITKDATEAAMSLARCRPEVTRKSVASRQEIVVYMKGDASVAGRVVDGEEGAVTVNVHVSITAEVEAPDATDEETT